jgi:hypothetical protein
MTLWRELTKEFPALRWETVKHISFTLETLEQVEEIVTQKAKQGQI